MPNPKAFLKTYPSKNQLNHLKDSQNNIKKLLKPRPIPSKLADIKLSCFAKKNKSTNFFKKKIKIQFSDSPDFTPGFRFHSRTRNESADEAVADHKARKSIDHCCSKKGSKRVKGRESGGKLHSFKKRLNSEVYGMFKRFYTQEDDD